MKWQVTQESGVPFDLTPRLLNQNIWTSFNKEYNNRMKWQVIQENGVPFDNTQRFNENISASLTQEYINRLLQSDNVMRTSFLDK